jgi:hypothetical protein
MLGLVAVWSLNNEMALLTCLAVQIFGEGTALSSQRIQVTYLYPKLATHETPAHPSTLCISQRAYSSSPVVAFHRLGQRQVGMGSEVYNTRCRAGLCLRRRGNKSFLKPAGCGASLESGEGEGGGYLYCMI